MEPSAGGGAELFPVKQAVGLIRYVRGNALPVLLQPGVQRAQRAPAQPVQGAQREERRRREHKRRQNVQDHFQNAGKRAGLPALGQAFQRIATRRRGG